MKHIQIEKWQVGDIIPTTSLSPMAAIIRRRTWPKRSLIDMSLSTHTAITVDRGGGLLYACEMGPWGIRMSELGRYDHGPKSWLAHPCMLLRHPYLSHGSDGLDRRNKISEFCIKMHSFHVRYGYEDLLRFIWPDIEDNPYRMVCSQFVVSALNHVDIPMPEGWFDRAAQRPGIVSPADIQRWGAEAKNCEVVEGAVK